MSTIMKQVAFCLLLVTWVLATDDTANNWERSFKTACIQPLGGDYEEFMTRMQNDFTLPNLFNTKDLCVMKCLLNMDGYVLNNGTVNVDKFLSRHVLNLDEMIRRGAQIDRGQAVATLRACEREESDGTECKKNYLIMQCVRRAVVELSSRLPRGRVRRSFTTAIRASRSFAPAVLRAA